MYAYATLSGLFYALNLYQKRTATVKVYIFSLGFSFHIMVIKIFSSGFAITNFNRWCPSINTFFKGACLQRSTCLYRYSSLVSCHTQMLHISTNIHSTVLGIAFCPAQNMWSTCTYSLSKLQFLVNFQNSTIKETICYTIQTT